MKAFLKLIFVSLLIANSFAFAEDEGEGDDSPAESPIRFDSRGRPINPTVEPRERLQRAQQAAARDRVSGARYQQCDPKLMESFYTNLFLLACEKSSMAGCPMVIDFEKLMKTSKQTLVMAGMSAGTGFVVAANTINNASMARAQLVFNNYAARADALFGRAAGNHFRQMATAREASQLRGLINAGRVTHAQNARYVSFLNVARASQRISRATLARAAMRGGGMIGISLAMIAFEYWMGQDDEERNCPRRIEYIDYDEDCKPNFEDDGEIRVGAQVKKFLGLEPHEQETLLRSNPNLCDYYKRFNAALASKIQIQGEVKNVRCDAGQGVRQYEVTEPNGGTKIMRLRVNEENVVQELTVERPGFIASGSNRQLQRVTMNFARVEDMESLTSVSYRNAFGIERRMNYSELATQSSRHTRQLHDNLSLPAGDIFESFRHHKFYSSLVNACCSIQADGARQQCVSEVEGQNGVTLTVREGHERATVLATPAPVEAPAVNEMTGSP